MIEISLTTALALYSGILLVGAVLLWLYTERSVHHSYQNIVDQHLWRCVFCACVYLDEGAGNMSRCPRCESINNLGDSGSRYVSPTRAQRRELKVPAEKPSGKPRGSKQKRPGQSRRGGRRRR